MGNVYNIARKEFRGYFGSPMAYVIMILFLLVVNILFFWGIFAPGFFMRGEASLRGLFMYLPYIFTILAPAITMRQWAEEKKIGTIEILLTLPVKDHEAVIGKYFAGVGFLALNLLLTFTIPLTVSSIGDPDLGPVVGGYLGALMLGGAYLAIGTFTSSITNDQIVSFILGVTVSIVIFIIGIPYIVMMAPGFLAPILQYLGMGAHFDNIARGVIDSRDVAYYVSIAVFFLLLTNTVIEKRR